MVLVFRVFVSSCACGVLEQCLVRCVCIVLVVCVVVLFGLCFVSALFCGCAVLFWCCALFFVRGAFGCYMLLLLLRVCLSVLVYVYLFGL